MGKEGGNGILVGEEGMGREEERRDGNRGSKEGIGIEGGNGKRERGGWRQRE